jgi:hypothetical protein
MSFATKKSMTKCAKWLHNLFNNHRILLQILCEKSCNHILMVHLNSRWWHNNRKDDIIFSLQINIHMTSMIDDEVMCISKISFENMIRIKSFQIWLKNNYANDMDKMMCHYINNVVIQLFNNDSKMIIWV